MRKSEEEVDWIRIRVVYTLIIFYQGICWMQQKNIYIYDDSVK